VLPDFFSAPASDLHACRFTMRDYEDEDRKKPQPVRAAKKGSNRFEIAEAAPWRITRQDLDADRHRHVV
jgi:hypothetical protein